MKFFESALHVLFSDLELVAIIGYNGELLDSVCYGACSPTVLYVPKSGIFTTKKDLVGKRKCIYG